MARVIGVKFKNSGKSYFFDPLQFDVHKDDHVVVETGKGIDYGTVVSDVREVADDKLFYPLKPIMRVASERDDEQVAANHEKEKEAFAICLEKVREHNLDMKLTEVEYAFDNSKILFYFTSDGYVDFRELVKDLAGIFKTRIELRQIGVRDEARALGGLGACGRPMCCATYLADFVPVSIKMAKEQNLPLNPSKISGVCGRLMCCLKNEEETYEELNKTMPDVGDFVEGNDGLQGDVFATNVLRQTVKVLVEVGGEKEMHDYEAADITVLRKRKGKKNSGNNNGMNMNAESVDEKQLEALEEEEEKENSAQENNKKERSGGYGRRDNRGERKSQNRGDGNSQDRSGNGENRSGNGENRGWNGENRGGNGENRNGNGDNRSERKFQDRRDRNFQNRNVNGNNGENTGREPGEKDSQEQNANRDNRGERKYHDRRDRNSQNRNVNGGENSGREQGEKNSQEQNSNRDNRGERRYQDRRDRNSQDRNSQDRHGNHHAPASNTESNKGEKPQNSEMTGNGENQKNYSRKYHGHHHDRRQENHNDRQEQGAPKGNGEN